MGLRRDVKFSQTLLALIQSSTLSHTRKKVAEGVGVTESALSQYVRGQSKPSLDTAVAIANFFQVGLDYLVFGESEVQPSPVDYGPFARYVDTALASLQERTEQRSEMAVRIARALSQKIEVVADGVLKDMSVVAGVLRDNETMILEEFSLDTVVLSMNLHYDVIQADRTKGDAPDEAAGRFLPIVANNLKQGRSCRFLLPKGLCDWGPVVSGYRRMLQSYCSNDLIARCRFKEVDATVLCGSGLYRLAVNDLRREHPLLYEQVGRFIDQDNWIGYTISPSSQFQADALMDHFHLRHARQTIAKLWKAGRTVTT